MNKPFIYAILIVLMQAVTPLPTLSQPPNNQTRFNVLALAETGDIHAPFVVAAKEWLNRLASDSNFHIDYLETPAGINEQFLSRYQLFIQLNYPPYNWTDTARQAFERYINEGHGGWIGLHHATLLGEFDGFPMWNWFSKFMGDIRFKNYIASFAAATVTIEDLSHPCFLNVPSSFTVAKDEWYTYNKSPRPNVQVLASVNEASYSPASDIRMGDHPVIWSNKQVRAKNIYIQMGHDPSLLANKAFTTIFQNAVFWAAEERR